MSLRHNKLETSSPLTQPDKARSGRERCMPYPAPGGLASARLASATARTIRKSERVDGIVVKVGCGI